MRAAGAPAVLQGGTALGQDGTIAWDVQPDNGHRWEALDATPALLLRTRHRAAVPLIQQDTLARLAALGTPPVLVGAMQGGQSHQWMGALNVPLVGTVLGPAGLPLCQPVPTVRQVHGQAQVKLRATTAKLEHTKAASAAKSAEWDTIKIKRAPLHARAAQQVDTLPPPGARRYPIVDGALPGNTPAAMQSLMQCIHRQACV